MENVRAIKRSRIKIYVIIFVICGFCFVGVYFWALGAKVYTTWDKVDFTSDIASLGIINVPLDAEGPYYFDEDNNMTYFYVSIDDITFIPIRMDNKESIAYLQERNRLQQQNKSFDQESHHTERFVFGTIRQYIEFANIPALEDALESSIGTKEYVILPYVIDAITYGDLGLYTFGFGVFVFVCFFCAWFAYWRAGSKAGEKMIEKYVQQHGESYALREEIDRFFDEEEFVAGFWMNRRFIAGIYNTTTQFAEIAKVETVCVQSVSGSGDLILSAIVLAEGADRLIFKLAGKRKQYSCMLNSPEDIQEIVEWLRVNCPWIKICAL